MVIAVITFMEAAMSLFEVFEGIDLPLLLSHQQCQHLTPQEVGDCEERQVAMLMLFLTRITVASSDQIKARYSTLPEEVRLRIEYADVQVRFHIQSSDGQKVTEVASNPKPN